MKGVYKTGHPGFKVLAPAYKGHLSFTATEVGSRKKYYCEITMVYHLHPDKNVRNQMAGDRMLYDYWQDTKNWTYLRKTWKIRPVKTAPRLAENI